VPFRPTLSLKVVRRLLRVGFPLMLTGVTAIALATADRLVVAAMAGTEALGYYAFAASIAGLAASGAWVIRIVILPDVYSHAVRAGAEPAVRHHLEGTLLSYARLFPPLLGLAALAIGPAVVLVLPQFAPAVPPARIFIFTGVTFGLVNLGALALVAADRQRRLPFYAVGALAINLFVSWALLRAGAGLEGVAAGAVLSQALYAAVVLDLGANAGGISGARFLIRALTPLAWCGVVVFVIGRLVPGSELTSFAVAIALYLVGLLPLYPSLWSESRKLHRMSRTRRALHAPGEESSA
jgi:O-antigen/teichoic acid export membrane protein